MPTKINSPHSPTTSIIMAAWLHHHLNLMKPQPGQADHGARSAALQKCSILLRYEYIHSFKIQTASVLPNHICTVTHEVYMLKTFII